MPKFFPGVTHAIVKTPANADVMTKLDGIAIVRLCFTSDEDFILVKISRMLGPTAGVTAILPVVPVPNIPGTIILAIQGKPADEVKIMALMAFDKVKQKFGLKYGKQYKVISNDIQAMESGTVK
jgi:hypothetical protein